MAVAIVSASLALVISLVALWMAWGIQSTLHMVVEGIGKAVGRADAAHQQACAAVEQLTELRRQIRGG